MRRFHVGKFLQLLAVGAGALVLSAPASAQERLAMGGTHGNSAFYSYQVAVVSDWNNAIDGLDISLQELGGASASTEALLRGEVDMGIAVTSADFKAYSGEGKEKLRTMYYFAPLPLNWVVAQDSGINDISGLKGAEFNPGGRGSATENQTESVANLLDLGIDLYRAGGSDALDAYQNRRIVGFVKAGMHPDGYIQQAHTSRPVKLLPMTEEQAKKVAEEFPYFSAATVSPGDNYGDQPESLTTVQTAIGINVSSDLSEDVVYQIVKRAFSPEGMAAAKSGYPAADRADPAELTLSAAVAPLHPGVVRYYKEAGVEVPERLIPPEYSN